MGNFLKNKPKQNPNRPFKLVITAFIGIFLLTEVIRINIFVCFCSVENNFM